MTAERDDMAETAEEIVNVIRSTTTSVVGRSVNRAGDYEIDVHLPGRYGGPPPEAATPADVFLAGVSSCAVLLIESMASEDGLAVAVQAEVEGRRDGNDSSWFTSVTVRITLSGCDEQTAERLVEDFKAKCPLYRTVAAATTISTSWEIAPA